MQEQVIISQTSSRQEEDKQDQPCFFYNNPFVNSLGGMKTQEVTCELPHTPNDLKTSN
jgi:hypothetical protein